MAGEKRGITPGTAAAVIGTAILLLACALFLFAIRERPGTSPDLLEDIVPTETLSPAVGALERAGTEEQPAPLPEAGATPEPQTVQAEEERSFTLLAGGALFVPRAVRECAQETGRYDFSTVFMGIDSSLEGADLSLLTLETLTDDRKPYDSANAPAAVLDALHAGGVDLVSLGTEVALDKGYDSLAVTGSELTSRGMGALGLRETQSGLPGTIMQVSGVCVAVLGYSYGISEDGAASTRGDERQTLALLREDEMIRDIQAARAHGAEVVILCVHWGVKNKTETLPATVEMAHRLADAGADIILGAHPNVVQPVERYEAKRADGLVYDTVICYSLGSLLTDARAEENMAGMLVKLSVSYDGAQRRPTLGGAEVIPTYIARQEEDARMMYRIVAAENEAVLFGLTDREREAAVRAAALVYAAAEGKETP